MKLGSRSVGPTKLAAGAVGVLLVGAVWPLARWLGPEIALVGVTAIAVAALLLAGLTRRSGARRAQVLENQLRASEARVASLHEARDELRVRLDELAREQRRQADDLAHLAQRSEQERRDQQRRTAEQLAAIRQEIGRTDAVEALGGRLDGLDRAVTRIGTGAGHLDDLRAAVIAEIADLRAVVGRAAHERAVAATPGERRVVAHDRTVERVRTSGLFDEDWYRRRHGVELDGRDPVAHYLDVGWKRGDAPGPLVDVADLGRRLLATDREPVGVFLDREAAGTLPRPEDPPVPLRADDPAADLELRWRYLLQGGHRHAHTFVLTRVVGNDLPPRHRAGQSLENLRFALAHEPDLPGCEKRWILNRIVDPDVESALVRCLEDHGASYTRLQFDWDDYRQVGWRFQDFPERGFVYGPRARNRSERGQSWLLDHVYHDKNRYAMHNNGARNLALEDGMQRARWVLPWDGNSFVTTAAWEGLTDAIRERPHLPYVLVPMTRAADNAAVLAPGFAPDAAEEPQVVFRADAREAFDPDRRYGRRPKVELLQRLGVPGPWDGWVIDPWEPSIARCVEEGRYQYASYVVRLSSGEPTLEVDADERGWRRTVAIQQRIDELDRRTAAERFSPDTLVTVHAAGDGATQMSRQLIEEADQLSAGPYTPSSAGLVELADELLVLTATADAAGPEGARYLDAIVERLAAVDSTIPGPPSDGAPTDLPTDTGGPARLAAAVAAVVLDAGRYVRRTGRLDASVATVLERLAGHARAAAGQAGANGVVGYDDAASTVWELIDELAGRSYLDDLADVLATARHHEDVRAMRLADRAGDPAGGPDAGPPDATPLATHEPVGWDLLSDAVRRLTGTPVAAAGRPPSSAEAVTAVRAVLAGPR